MIRRKGELTSKGIDNLWPHQIALRASLTTGRENDVVREFCKDLSLAPRGHTFFRDDEYVNVWCFSAISGSVRQAMSPNPLAEGSPAYGR